MVPESAPQDTEDGRLVGRYVAGERGVGVGEEPTSSEVPGERERTEKRLMHPATRSGASQSN